MLRKTFRLSEPAVTTAPLIVSSPHSGREYDWDFLTATVLDADRIRSSEDAYIDVLLERVPTLGVPLLAASMPRAFLDLNRAPEELDPAVIRDLPRGQTNPRISSGLGVIPRVVAQGRAIYEGKISHREARQRIDRVWRPYHAQLAQLMEAAHRRFGQAILLDVHSMPHEAIEGTGSEGATPQIVLGDRFGASAAPDLMDRVESVFVELGFRVARNTPFAGAYITQTYGRPGDDRHAIQIEIDRALYLDEVRVRPMQSFDEMQRLLTEAVARICAEVTGLQDMAAE